MEREQTAAEKAYLEDLLSRLPTSRRRTKEAIENFFVMLAVLTILGVLVWAGFGWLAQKTMGLQIGWSSEYALPIVAVILVVAGIYSSYSTTHWMKSWPESRQPVRDDLLAGLVSEEQLTVLETKLLQEPEHGSLIYFLRSDDDRVLVLYDRESLDLAMADEDPMGSSFEPQSNVSIVRAPRSGFTIKTTFSGGKIDVHGPTEITAAPGKWPEDEEYSPIPWAQIEQQLCG
ncbi:MAG: hypothetical protein AAFY56_10460 [Pseudomonadota bacterium]